MEEIVPSLQNRIQGISASSIGMLPFGCNDDKAAKRSLYRSDLTDRTVPRTVNPLPRRCLQISDLTNPALPVTTAIGMSAMPLSRKIRETDQRLMIHSTGNPVSNRRYEIHHQPTNRIQHCPYEYDAGRGPACARICCYLAQEPIKEWP